ncbi:lipid II flippase family protein [Priestia endophytica]|uniref:Lipid II flippase Amj n=1 Tax=Priestia endophytica TaxID=135735 RepID=A0AAX1Q8H1_9BACI|nr:DUF2837 family protein [Priestia endophytica]RAS76345.1 hypothetical protein A3864_13115 [Priestia endophytica]
MIVVLIMVLTGVIHFVETSCYSIRFGGVKLKKIAVSLSIASAVLLIARTSNLSQSMLLGNMVDSVDEGMEGSIVLSFRLILLSASIGTLISIVAYPTMAKLSPLLIKRFEIEGSLMNLMTLTNIKKLRYVPSYIRKPRITVMQRLRIGGIPKRMMLTNIFVTSVYTTGVLSALYASILDPAHSATSIMSAGIINGVATILFTLCLDPPIALLTERALIEDTGSSAMTRTYIFLMISRLIGTLVSQIFFLPAAVLITYISKLIGVL